MLAAILTLIIALTAVVYLRGWLRLRRMRFNFIPAWRAWSFLTGLLSTWIAVASPLSSLDGSMLTAHMAQHLLLMTIAPPLIWLGEPLRALSLRAKGAGRLLGHPAFCWLSAAAVLVVWHVPALLRLGMESPSWHLIEQASFFTAGLLFWWPVAQPWPSVERWPRWSILMYLFFATLPCDVLSGLLVFSDRVLYPMYLCKPVRPGLSALEDQQCAGALMWTGVTLVFLVAGAVLSTQLLSPRRGISEVVEGLEI